MITTNRRRLRVLVAALVLAVAPVPAGAAKGSNKGPGSEKARLAKISARVLQEARKQSGGSRMDVIVKFRKAPGAGEFTFLKGIGGQRHPKFKSTARWQVVRLPASSVDKLAEHPSIDFVASDPSVYAALEVARQAANEPAPNAPESLLKGAGVTIAVVDSGVALHADIQTLTAAVDFTDATETLLVDELGLPVAPNHSPLASIDPNGHGTHVAGIMVGTGAASPQGRLAGVAPEASLVSVRVLDDQGRGTASDVLAGLEWILANKGQFGIRVVNISLGHPVYEPAAQDPLVQAVDALWDAGVVVVCSAGNSGRNGFGTVTSPCNSRKVITVGALNARGTADPTDDTVTTYSSRGPAVIDLVAKPDIVAPGNRIVSARSAGSYLDTLFPERRVAADPNQPEVTDYLEMSGTSMASPMVAGAAALMIQQDPSLTPAAVKARLMLSAKKTTFGHPFATGAGALDILGALQATGTVAQAPSPLVSPDQATGQISVENTAVLWGNEAFSIMSLWSAGVLWSDPTQTTEPVVSTYGVLWPDGGVSPDGTLWPDAALWPDGALWPDSALWPDMSLWSESVLWPDGPGAFVDMVPLALGWQDPQ